MSQKIKINKEIRASRVRLITEDGQQLGVISLAEALLKAEEQSLDLVQVSPDSDVPVVKLIDWGKYRYEQEKKQAKARKQQKNQDQKGIRLSVKIGKHDFDTKLAHAKEFIEKGSKLSLQLRFKGREMAYPELGEKVLRQFVTELGEVKIEQEPKIQGRSMTMIVSKNTRK